MQAGVCGDVTGWQTWTIQCLVLPVARVVYRAWDCRFSWRWMCELDTLTSRHVSSCDVNACSWDVRDYLTLNSMGADSHFCHSAYVTWSRVELWSAHVPARLSNFCCRTHFVRRDVRVESSSDVTSCFQKWRKCLLKKCANGPFYMTPSHQIIEISIWEPTHGKG